MILSPLNELKNDWHRTTGKNSVKHWHWHSKHYNLKNIQNVIDYVEFEKIIAYVVLYFVLDSLVYYFFLLILTVGGAWSKK